VASWNQPGFGSHQGLHPGTSQDMQPPQQGDITNTFSHHRYWQSKITFIDKLARITSSFKLLSLGLVWMESWENRLNQAVSDPNQASQAGFSGNNTWLKNTEWVSTFLVTINSRFTAVELALSVDGLLKNVLAQHLPDTLYIFCGNIYRRFEILQNTIIYENTSRNHFLKSDG
jgi:hypothetical protein